MKALRFYLIMALLILGNIINMVFPKGVGLVGQVGIIEDLSKYIYGLAIVIMLPSVFSTTSFYFSKMKYMAFVIVFYIVFAYASEVTFELSQYIKMFMICISFVFFEDVFDNSFKIDRRVIVLYIISAFLNVVYLTILQNRLGIAIDNEGETSGGQSLANVMVLLVPLFFYFFKGRVSVFLYSLGLIVVLVSLRRTAILAYLLCLPFIVQYMQKGRTLKGTAILLLIGVSIIVFYIYTHYWYIIQDRFMDMLVANDEGNYGSGRTGWWRALIVNYLSAPLHYLQGFGLGRVAIDMELAGAPYGHAHSGYLEIIYTFGLLGFYLWFGTFRNILKIPRADSIENCAPLIRMSVYSYLFISLFSASTFQPNIVCVALFAVLMLRRSQWVESKVK